MTTFGRWNGTALRCTAGLLCLAFAGSAMAAEAWSLESFLKEVEQSNPDVQAAKLQRESAELNKRQADLQELSPYLQAELGYMDDKRETLMPAMQGNRTQATQYSLGVAKKFSTGTSVAFKWGQTQTGLEGFAAPVPKLWESGYTFSVSQSLWQNAFGRGTRLRHEREDAMARVGALNAALAERQALIAAEEAYWDLALQTLDRTEKAAALTRATRIRDWTAKRLDNGIGDKADLLQMDALLALRKLNQIGTEDSYENARKRFLDILQKPDASLAVDTAGLSAARPLPGANEDRRSLGVWLQSYAARIQESVALETEDKLRPDLSLVGAIGANGRDTSNGTSAGEAFSVDHPMLQVGVKFTMNLDFGLKDATRQAVQNEAQAAKLKSDRALRDQASAWPEMVRKHRELGARINALEALLRAQEAKFSREQERLSVGRTTTFQVIDAEQGVADTRLQLLQLRYQQRRVEAAARLYLTQESVEAL